MDDNLKKIYQDFESRLKILLKEGKLRKDDSDTIWTLKIKEIFSRMGEERGYVPYASSSDGEYLLDLCWSEEDKGTYRKLILGLESEWGGAGKKQRLSEVEEDFYKLLDVKCKVKVLIYHVDRNEWTDDFHARFQKILSDYENHSKDESYLFIEFMDDKIAGYSCTPLQDGRIKGI